MANDCCRTRHYAEPVEFFDDFSCNLQVAGGVPAGLYSGFLGYFFVLYCQLRGPARYGQSQRPVRPPYNIPGRTGCCLCRITRCSAVTKLWLADSCPRDSVGRDEHDGRRRDGVNPGSYY
ncbi:hypothetical protein D3C73_1242670 [compost metagenome]